MTKGHIAGRHKLYIKMKKKPRCLLTGRISNLLCVCFNASVFHSPCPQRKVPDHLTETWEAVTCLRQIPQHMLK